MIAEPAPAKLNLALHVRRRRGDGYHELETLFAFCRDGDVVTVAAADADDFAIVGPFADSLPSLEGRGRGWVGPSGDGAVPPPLPTPSPSLEREGGDNLVVRARDAFRGATGIDAPCAITLDKRLPVASGIGGGSADAAATLRALARLHGVPVERLGDVAAGLGADVPACLAGRTALGTGRGDALDARDGLAGTPVLLVNPLAAVSTAAVFAGWDGVDRGALAEGDLRAVALAGRNDLAAPARAIAPVIDDVLGLLAAQAGAWLVRLSGSGATCFALFDDAAARDAADAAMAAARPGWWRLATALA